MRFEIRPCYTLSRRELTDLKDEFYSRGEFINVLWDLYDMDPEKWKMKERSNMREAREAFFVDGVLVGVARITRKPNHIENGNIGFAIRPTERGKRYATVFINLIHRKCMCMGVENPTACIDARNERSIKAFMRAGWRMTGRSYRWNPDPDPRVAIEMCPYPKD